MVSCFRGGPVLKLRTPLIREYATKSHGMLGDVARNKKEVRGKRQPGQIRLGINGLFLLQIHFPTFPRHLALGEGEEGKGQHIQ